MCRPSDFPPYTDMSPAGATKDLLERRSLDSQELHHTKEMNEMPSPWVRRATEGTLPAKSYDAFAPECTCSYREPGVCRFCESRSTAFVLVGEPFISAESLGLDECTECNQPFAGYTDAEGGVVSRLCCGVVRAILMPPEVWGVPADAHIERDYYASQEDDSWAER
jgi:hypothetical protein